MKTVISADSTVLSPAAGAFLATAALFALASYAVAKPAATRVLSARQIARRIDKEVQPRFQMDAGLFGVEREINETVIGHRQVESDLMTSETPDERTALKPVTGAPYYVVMGIMHVRHKPGAHRGAHDRSEFGRRFKPSSEVLEASGTDYPHALRTFGWAERHIGPATRRAYRQVRNGKAVAYSYGKFYVSIRPIKARQRTCIGCHVGAHMNDTLGAMIYMVAPTPRRNPATSVAYEDADHQAG